MQSMKAIRRAGRAVSTAKRNRLSAAKQRAMLQQLEPVRGIEKIVIKPTGQMHPSMESVPGFVNLNFGPNIVKAIEETGIHKPTVIQMLAAPAILNGNHVLCGAETGSGKTLAYLAPVMHQLKHEEETVGMMARINRPRAIILCPSRELASQVLGVAKSLCHDARLRIVGIIGGKKKRIIQESLYSPVDIAVATLSTLLRYLRRGKISLADLTHLVIDEADTMFDESFIQDLKGVLKNVKVRTSFPPTPPVDDTQVIVVTATVSSELEKKVNMVVPNIRVVTTRSLHKVLPNIKQVFLKVRQDEKGDKLVELLRAHSGPHYKTIVFCNTVRSCTWAAKHLATNGIPVAKYHGGIHPVIHKQRPLQDFVSDDQSVLVCTDIASRGIDCSKINHVIQYDFPTSVTDYLHRVGRTGRVGGVTQCLATTLMTKKKDVRVALKIERAANKKAPIADEELVSKKNDKKKLVVNDGKKRDNLKHPT